MITREEADKLRGYITRNVHTATQLATYPSRTIGRTRQQVLADAETASRSLHDYILQLTERPKPEPTRTTIRQVLDNLAPLPELQRYIAQKFGHIPLDAPVIVTGNGDTIFIDLEKP